jgi:hypothetical protein
MPQLKDMSAVARGRQDGGRAVGMPSVHGWLGLRPVQG